MTGILVSIYDSKAETYSPPEVAPTRAAAIRQFEMLVKSPEAKGIIQKHPEDFSLFEIGSFEDDKIVSAVAPVRLISGNEVQRDEV